MRRGRGRARGVRLEGEVAVMAVDDVAVRRRVRRPGAVLARRAVRAVRPVGVARGGAAVRVRGDAVDGGQAAVALRRAARDAVRRVHRDQRRRDRLDAREGVPATQINGRWDSCYCYSPRHSWWRPNPSLVLLKGAIAENTVLIAILMRFAGGAHLDRLTDGRGV